MANSRKHLIYLVYGRQTYHQEALFSIASAFAPSPTSATGRRMA